MLLGATTCSTCVAGKYVSEHGCDLCDPGSYSYSDGSAACIACDIGEYASGSGTPYQCDFCEPGSFSGSTGASWCVLCSPSTFAAIAGAGNCEACPDGQYSTLLGATVCSLCAAGKYFSSWRMQINTGPATWNEAEQSCMGQGGQLASIDSEAESEYLTSLIYSSNAYNLYWIGYYTNNVSSGSWRWADGSESSYIDWNSKNDETWDGMNYYYQEDSVCAVVLGLNYWAPGSWQEEECFYTLGFVCEFDPCETCVPGTYSSEQGSSSCDACPAGTFVSAIGAINCTECASGSFSNESSSICIQCTGLSMLGCDGDCPEGQYWDALESVCLECPPGFYKDEIGPSNCSICESGTYAPASYASNCVVCDIGTFSNGGASFCEPCPSGSWNAETGAGNCTECESGSYSTALEATSDSICQICDSGTFSDAGAPSLTNSRN